MARPGSLGKVRTSKPREGRLRIIGGTWRSRRLPVPAVPGLRPTPDRVRETVFNWLAPVIEGARCLDLYAGTGALGLEALSRGAAGVVFVDRNPVVLRSLKASLETLGCDRGELHCLDAMSYLSGAVTPFDIVFLDPPYRLGMLEPAVTRVVGNGWPARGASLYLEHEAGGPAPPLPAGWQLFRSAAAGQVRYHLARQTAGAAEGS